MSGIVASPLTPVFICLLLGLFFLFRRTTRDHRKTRLLLVAGVLLLCLFSSGILKNGLVYLLESNYPFPNEATLKSLDAVVVLPGGTLQKNALRPMAVLNGFTYARLVCGVRVFQDSDAEYLVLMGGTRQIGRANNVEAAVVMRDVALALGVEAERIVMETESLNTRQHAQFFGTAIGDLKLQRVGLVTSALHLPRSVAAFSRYWAGEIVPVPCDHLYETGRLGLGSLLPSSGALYHNSMLLHELVGSAWYWLLDRNVPKPAAEAVQATQDR